MRPLARLCTLAILLTAGCATDKPPATESGPAKSEGGDVAEAEAGPIGGEGGGGETCQSDADCVPAPCCHPNTCVIAAEAPNCSDTMCTENCEVGTLDCGQGHCACQEGKCTAVIDKPLE
jgi:hypothetical protein